MQAKKSEKLSEFELLDSTEKKLKQFKFTIDEQTGKLTVAYNKQR